ncbi:hypothetical protein FJV41_13305 [Myxococcus llanfairpwllgwyngyllgogerychwyrndrobwllllantysiliogogogochensis]|uniref:Lipoprotein n=1 Tax=Myxococcus llanfairpwllgwyngyllgogerychwyrndrobwllllantysiliogogogochensis TaxID=2590453 RepID=A0A540X2P0_9BACT|nr:hypothetical protein [Myxococcus llanfairpwllgwyngyllgogerychwyrndrobwllllantysiliogogogochensis]TQF15496.1 hypothetical protein FJV41_13305 [Myxococcus llanfairpwllgwyngyllgogerychwyrndrobwllllantysiliogogogochensis]
MRSLRTLSIVVSLLTLPVLPALAEEPKPTEKSQTAEAERPKCEHGVQKSLCTRCNPKLAAVFKAKGDWCAEHERPESQCSICNPALSKKGVK